MSGKRVKQLRQISRTHNLPYRKLKKAYNMGVINIVPVRSRAGS